MPGCGAGWDAMALARHGLVVTGLDLAPTAAARFREVREAAGLSGERVEIRVGDFFAFAPEQPFDVVWDYTFLCAIEPEQREAWAAKMHSLVAPSGELNTLIFPTAHITGERHGPPFQLVPEEVRALVLAHGFEMISLEPLPEPLSHPGRGGLEWLGRWVRI